MVLVGKPHMPTLGGDKPPHQFEAGGFPVYNILAPDDKGPYKKYERSNAVVERVADLIGRDKIFAIIAYNYPMHGVRGILKFSRENGIVPIVDTTEWYGVGGYSPTALLRFVEHEYRMRVVQKKVGNLMCGSSYLADFYKDCNTIVLPNCVDVAAEKWSAPIPARTETRRRFIFVGSPGARMKKENVGAIVSAFAQCKAAGEEFAFDIVGITRDQLLEGYPGINADVHALKGNLTCHGRLPHLQALSELRNSDFFVFLRPDTRANKAGCPTKLAEAFTCGIPTIVNRSGDIPRYMTSPLHGILINDPEVSPLANAIREGLRISDERLGEMKSACARDNPFKYQAYEPVVKDFLARAR